jgi:catalase
MKPKAGVLNFTREEAMQQAGKDPDFMSRSLYKAIEEGGKTGNFPQWDVKAQIM